MKKWWKVSGHFLEVEPTKLAELKGYSYGLDVSGERRKDSRLRLRFLAEKVGRWYCRLY